MATPPGYADISVAFRHASLVRSAFLTFGVDPTATDPSQIATSVATAIGATNSLLACIDSNVTMVGVRVSLGTDGSEDLVYQMTASTPCTLTNTSTPPNVALLVHKNTGRGGRRGRGRLFIPWATANTDVAESGIVTPARVTSANTQMQNFLTALGVNTVPMVLLHGPGLTAPGAPNTVNSLIVDPLISTQRRRLGR